MSHRKFGDNDVFINTMKAYPNVEFFTFNGVTYFNNIPAQTGSRNDYVRNVPPGHISLYEYNIDRPTTTTGRTIPLSGGVVSDNGTIYPWISKDSARSSFRTAEGFQATSAESYNNEFKYGDLLTGSYPLKATVTREYIPTPYTSTASFNAHYVALRNRLNFYGLRSQHYKVSSSYGNKDNQRLNLISIPSIFYGSQIKPGSLSLKWYVTGSLVGELRDLKENGELVQVGPVGSTGSGSVAGVALYDEGFILLTGSWELNGDSLHIVTSSAGTDKPKWIYYGGGMNDSLIQSTAGGASFVSASFGLSFKGTTETQVMTLFAHAKKGEVNYSNNPTFLTYGQDKVFFTSSHVYEESSDITIKNSVSSSYLDYNAPFKRQVYVSKVAIYDEHKNLIGVATLSNPVLKEEDQDYSFKLRLDF